jgi:hypothetical protein
MRGRSGNRADRSRSHGYEKRWEETHNDEEGQSSQDGEEGRAHRAQDRARDRAGGAQDGTQNRREEKGAGKTRNRAQDNGKEDLCPQDGSAEASGAETCRAQGPGAQARSGGETHGCPETRGAGPRCREAGTGPDGPAAAPSRPDYAEHG